MSQKITHWAQLLPDAGDVIRKEALRIASLRDKAAHDYSVSIRYANEADYQLNQRVKEQWNQDDISAAKLKFVQEYYEGDLIAEPVHYEDNEAERFQLPDGRWITISKIDKGFVRSLRKLPVQTRIRILHLTAEECATYYIDTLRELKEQVVKLFAQKWYWRETGDKVAFDSVTNESLFGIFDTKQSILRQVRNGKIEFQQLRHIINVFTSERSEIYQKEKN